MCDFLTAAAIAGTVVSAAASIGGGVMQYQQAQANARTARREAAFEEDRAREQARRLLAAQRVGYAKAGVTPEGSPLEVAADTAAQQEIDALAIRWGGRQRAEAFRSAGTSALVGGLGGAGGALLTGVTSWGQNLLQPGAPQLPRPQRLTQTGVPGVY